MRRIFLLFFLSMLSLSAQETPPKIYFIYNASGTMAGELNYLYGKYFWTNIVNYATLRIARLVQSLNGKSGLVP